MKKVRIIIASVFLIAVSLTSCKGNKDGEANVGTETHDDSEKVIPLDTTQFASFYQKYPEFKQYSGEISDLYKKHPHYIWHEKRGLIEFAEVLYNKINQLDDEGLSKNIPYKKTIDEVFEDSGRGERPNVQTELLISSMYFYWANRTIDGLPAAKSRETGWFLPRENTDLVAYLDTLMKDPQKVKGDNEEVFTQYFALKKGLAKYREIQKKGGWKAIELPEGAKVIQEGDNNAAVAQLRARLAAEGYLKSDSKSTEFDKSLADAVTTYEKNHFREYDGKVGPAILGELNVSVAERIKTITVNMERCRWIPSRLNDQKEYIAVNIPSYRLRFVRDGKIELISNVVVGKELNKTVVFTGNMSYIAFSPYWNIPPSIVEKEIKPGIAKNKNYLADHNMEYYNGSHIRQKPGGENSLGKVKFMFPNSNNIYLHDTPAKSLFNQDDRAFSHGCVRVEKARELAIMITGKDGGWDEKKVDEAMNSDKENTYALKKKIPVYITYFTAWADEDGNVAFFEDIYNRDVSLENLLYKE